MHNQVASTGNETQPTAAPVAKLQHPPHFISKQELAGKLGVSGRTIDTWVARRRIPVMRLSPRMNKFNFERVLAALGRYEIREIGRGAK